MPIERVTTYLLREGYGNSRSMQCITFVNVFVTVEGLPRSVEDFAKEEEFRSGNWCGVFDVYTDLIPGIADVHGNPVVDFSNKILVLWSVQNFYENNPREMRQFSNMRAKFFKFCP